MATDDLVVFAVPAGGVADLPSFAREGLRTATVHSASALRARLADEWGVAVVAVDLALADAALLDELQRPGAPRALFLLDDDRWLDAITLAANVGDYLPATIGKTDLHAAVLAALPTATVAGVGDFSDRDSARLNALGSEVERIARALNDLAHEAKVAMRGTDDIGAPYVRALIKQRRERERFFPAALFSDPAWDMLLDLTAARLERRYVSVSSLCIAAAVPTTTALRWIRNLGDLGLFERNTDPDDARRALISLSDATATRMLGYLAAVRGGGTP